MALAKWYKIDFHTHTPESTCFPDKNVTPEQWLKAAKDSGINAVVVSDHNSVGWVKKIEEVKVNFEDRNFKVFYGIELCVSSDFTHFLIIFDDKMSVTEIEDAVISHLGLQRKDWGDTTVNVSEDKLKTLCTELNERIFVIPAHFASNKGLGKSTENAIKKYQDFLSFSAIEVRNDEDIREYNNKLKNKAINSAVLVTGSDNPSDKEAQHSIEGFGKMFTWVKLSMLSFEGLRQVFIDPEHRCINWIELQKIGEQFDPNETTYNYISGIEFEGISHMTKMNMRFSPNLNCIVGGRGTGKSTIVDAINYGVCNEKDLSKCKLLEKTLTKDAKISTFFNFGIAKPYVVKISRKGKQLVSEVEDNDGIVTNPPEFKIDFYGQKEIFSLIDEDDSIANQTTSPLVKMIDDKVSADMYSFSDEIDDEILNMLKYSDEFKSNRRRIKELPTIKAEIEKADAILKKFKASGIEKTRKDFETVDNKIKSIEKSFVSELAIINDAIDRFEQQGEELGVQIGELDVPEENATEIEALKRLRDINQSLVDLLNQKGSVIDSMNKAYKLSSTYAKREEIHDEYLKALEEVKNTGGEDINSIQDQLQKNKQRYSDLITLQNEQENIEKKIEKSIAAFVDKRLELSQKRQAVIDGLNLENISIKIISLGHLTRWKANLQKELGREGTFDNDFQNLVEKSLSADNDWKQYKALLKFMLITDSGNIEDLFGPSTDARFTKLWMDKYNNGTLSSMVKVLPEDKLQIKIIDENGSIDINEGSPGQKSAAILAFILNSGENPLIIDQPEDDLDNSLIYSLVVKSIRKMKSKRQIIIVTHNPNIPVLGDAEGIVVLERNNQGKVTFRKDKKTGCIEEKIIREGICEIMEGGEDAFRKREQKYQYK
ncbi:TrlF family AAA-like ATPase [Hungatella sp.]|uniref:TrlF family AAA-like ATPase n=2 Tax=Lachnospiraceae TaxID=186803 RepID=UPI002A83FE5C|nr:AAA family ATPase [Hungatella sp.]